MTTLLNGGQPFTAGRDGGGGLSRHELRELASARTIRRVLTRVYVDARVPDSRALRTRALSLVIPEHGVIYGCTAAWARTVDAYQPEQRFDLQPQCLVPHGASRVRARGVRCVEGYLAERDVIDIGGVRSTNDVRTTVDLLRRLRRPFALSAADAMARAGLVIVPEIAAAVARLRHFPGVVQARSLVALIDPRSESAGESWQRLRLIDAGFPRPHVQYSVTHRGREIARLDHAYPDLFIGTEYDGREFHSLAADCERDAQRRAMLREAFGWRFVVAGGSGILGWDPSYEWEVGRLLGMEPLPRFW